MNKALQVLIDRGFFKACTDIDALSDLMDKEPVKFYLGVDPTGPSVHIGHMVPFFAMHHLQENGHNPIALVGGGTSMIGDPSGKTEMRKMLTSEQIDFNSASIKKQLGSVVNFNDEVPEGWGHAKMMNNADWIRNLNYIEFLRDIGKHFSVNKMLTFESYKQRLARGLSFIEFNYQLLQSFDFLTLYKNEGCRLQIGGDDQWGNIVAGIDLIRKKEAAECYGLTFNLITRADGKKMGKSEKGAIFLDPKLCSPYDFYQYWRNVNDLDVFKFMKLFTFLDLDEIESYKNVNINEAKIRLAWEQTKITHGREEADKARDATKAIFATGGNKLGMPSADLSKTELDEGINVIDFFFMTGLFKTKSEARRLIQGGGGAINDKKVTDLKMIVNSDMTEENEITIRAGKKKFFRFMVK